jgi:hypothetical protein
LRIVWVADGASAREYTAGGYEPVECAFGEESVLGPLEMDHHGRESGREGVALRAYRDHFGALEDRPWFVVTGAADADACFAIAALAGLLPPPRDRADPEPTGPGRRDLIGLARLINQIDVAPIGVRLADVEDGTLLLLWNQLSAPAQDAAAFYGGVDRWRTLVIRAPEHLLEAARGREATRVEQARAATVERISDRVALVEGDVWGFDVWYAEVAEVILAFNARSGQATIGCRDAATATRLFGAGGLRIVFPLLAPAGWGGRDAIGGSPRGARLTRSDARAAAAAVADIAG